MEGVAATPTSDSGPRRVWGVAATPTSGSSEPCSGWPSGSDGWAELRRSSERWAELALTSMAARAASSWAGGGGGGVREWRGEGVEGEGVEGEGVEG